MYVGRLIVIGPTVGAYRVSSRSFPNRKITRVDPDTYAVVPTQDADEQDNPYVSYNCLRHTAAGVVLGNGSHVDPTADKLELGYPPRDALAHALLALDYEKDDYNTPRIAGVIGDTAHAGIVRNDALIVREVNEPTLVATYEADAPTSVEFDAASAGAAARAAMALEYEHAVCAVGVATENDAFEVAIENQPPE